MVTYYDSKAFPGLQIPLLGLHPLVLEQEPWGLWAKGRFLSSLEVKDKHTSESVNHVQLSVKAHLAFKSTHYSLGCGCQHLSGARDPATRFPTHPANNLSSGLRDRGLCLM